MSVFTSSQASDPDSVTLRSRLLAGTQGGWMGPNLRWSPLRGPTADCLGGVTFGGRCEVNSESQPSVENLAPILPQDAWQRRAPAPEPPK